MRRTRSSFRPQVNIPKAKKPKKEEPSVESAVTIVAVPSVNNDVEEQTPAAPETPTTPTSVSSNNVTITSVLPKTAAVEKEVKVVHSPVKSIPPPIFSAPPLPPPPRSPSPESSSSSEDEGVIDPYDPNNPQGTRSDRLGPNRKCDRLAKTSCGGKPTSMIDYLYYNPKENPMTYTQSKSAQSANRSDEEEEDVDDPDEEIETESQSRTFAPTVQLKIGPDGTFQVDEKSLVQETTEARKGRERMSKTAISSSSSIIGSKCRTSRIKWTDAETVFFYKCLAAVGTDFEIISKYFPGRSRHHIKLKFKLEERVNSHLITLAMKTSHYDVSELKSEFESVAKKAKEERSGKRKTNKTSTGKRRRKGAKRGSEDEDEEANLENLESSDEDLELEAELDAEMRVDEKTSIKKIKQETKQTKTTPEKPVTTLASVQQPKASSATVVSIPALKLSLQTNMAAQTPPVRNPVIRQILSTGPRNIISKAIPEITPNKTSVDQIPSNEISINQEIIKDVKTSLEQSNHEVQIMDLKTGKISTLNTSACVMVQSETTTIVNNQIETIADEIQSEQYSIENTSFSVTETVQVENQIIQQGAETINIGNDLVVINETKEPKPDRVSRRKDTLTVKVPYEDFEEEIENNVKVPYEDFEEEKDNNDCVVVESDLENETESDNEENEEELSEEGDSSDSTEMEMEFLSKVPQPTRSGRVPKITAVKPISEESIRKPVKKRGNRKPKSSNKKVPEPPHQVYYPLLPPPPSPDVSSPEPSEADSSFNEEDQGIAPGSLVILKTATPDDPNNEFYEVFMVPPRSGGATLAHNPDGSVQKVSVGAEKPLKSALPMILPQSVTPDPVAEKNVPRAAAESVDSQVQNDTIVVP